MISRRAFLAGTPLAARGQQRSRLNFLLILADDLGAGELGCYGNTKHRTPNLDALAGSGVRFETCYATPLCSPSRVLLMTGRYAYRTGWYNFIGRITTRKDRLSADEITFADVLKERGYRTGLAGKWQLGLVSKHPTMIHDSGFDEYFSWAWNTGGLPKGSPFEGHERNRYWHPAIVENGRHVQTQPHHYGPDLYSGWIADFMKRNRERPFLAYYPMCLTHEPWDPTPVPGQPGKKTAGGLQANVEYMDHVVGKLVRALDDLGLRENTVVIFTGDNGTGKNGKATVTEKGVRVPMIVSCPGTIQQGVVSRDLIDFSDVLPTLTALSGTPLPCGATIDGRSFAPQLMGKRGNPREWIFSYLAYERMLRDERWLLEGDGKLYDCGKSRNGEGYKEVTTSSAPEVLAARARFEKILAKLPAPPRN
ncbi:MAG: sulfatase-like hydrolase/transferase [Bryobacteraceae bacterium]